MPSRSPMGGSACGDVVGNSNTDDRSYQWRGTRVVEAYANRYSAESHERIRPAFFYGGYETRINGTPTAEGVPPPFSVEDMSRLFRCGVHIHWENEALSNLVNWDRMFQAGEEYRSAFDYWLVLYFMSLGAVGVPIPSCFSIYNQRPDSLEQIDKERNTFESIRAIQTFFPHSQSIIDLETKTKIETPDFYHRYEEFKDGFR